MLEPTSIINVSEPGVRFIADEHLRMIKDEAIRNVAEIKAVQAASIVVDPQTGQRTYYSQGQPLVELQGYVYIKEGEDWEEAPHMKLPDTISKLIHAEEGALVIMSGPFYVREKTFPYGSGIDPEIRPLTDEEVYERYGLKRVYDTEHEPFAIPVLGIGGRSILLPITYTVMNTAINEKRYIFGLEFKGAGTPAYEKHNINNSFPSTVFKSDIGKAGIFLDRGHQLITQFPIGLTAKDDAIGPEVQVLKYGNNFTRLNCANLPLDDEYSIKMRVPLGDYRRLAIFFDQYGDPKRNVFEDVIKELGSTPEEYLIRLAKNYGATLKMLVEGGYILGAHTSMIDCDIWGNVTDLEDFGEIKTGEESFFLEGVLAWVDNLFKVASFSAGKNVRNPVLLPEENIPGALFKEIKKAFADSFFSDLEDYDELREELAKMSYRQFGEVIWEGAVELFKNRRKEEASRVELIYSAA